MPHIKTSDGVSLYYEETGSGAPLIFLHEFGEPFEKNRLSDLVKRYLRSAGIDKPGSCHLFRHAMATQMLENGADTRYLQAMLGHASLESTQLYTHVSIRKLKEIHSAAHPAARLVRGPAERGGVDAGELLEQLEAEWKDEFEHDEQDGEAEAERAAVTNTAGDSS